MATEKVLDYVVVGSGPSGAMAAQTLVEAGADVTMLDVGIVNTDKNDVPANKNLLDLRQKDTEQYNYLIGDHVQGLAWKSVGKGAQVTPPRAYMIQDTETYIPVSSTTFSPLESLGYGGLGIGWGLQCWTYSPADLQKVGLDSEKIKRAYDVVAERIGVSATRDTAAKYTIGDLQTIQPSAGADKNHQYILKRYLRHERFFKRKGIFIGRTPLALITKDQGRRKGYRYLETDFYNDADQSAWRPWITVNMLRRRKNFHYINGQLVVSFQEKNTIVTIRTIDTDTNEKHTYLCKNLILASGALGTARIVLRSQAPLETKTPILSNAHSYIPCIQPLMFGRGYESKKLGFGQLSYFIDPDGNDSNISVASSYGYQSLMLFRIINQMPFNFADGRILTRFLAPGLVVIIAQHPDGPSANKYLKLVKDSGSPTGDKLAVKFVLSDEEEKDWDRRDNAYLSTMRRLGTFPVKRLKTEHGSSIHYAGTLPFSDKSERLHLSSEGRLHKTKHVYVADSSGFRYLPAKGLTFTLMANAHLVAETALRDNEKMTEKKVPTVAITGASGFVGTLMTDYFLAKGWHVVALVRTPGNERAGLEYRNYDIGAPLSASTLKGVDYLVHTAYVKLDSQHPDAVAVNVDGAKRLIKSAVAANVKRMIFISTMSAHEEAISAYGKQKLAIEELFLKQKNATVIRSGLIIGNGGIVREMASFMKSKHAVPLIHGGTQPLQIISVYDLIKAIDNLMARSLSGRYVVATPKVYTYKQFYAALAKHLRVKVVYVPVPYWALETLFTIVSKIGIPLGVGSDNLKGLKKLTAMPSRDDMNTIGVKPLNLDEALKQALA